MPKTLNCVVTYDETTRELKSEVTLNEFVEDVPEQVVTGQEVQTLTLFADGAMSSADMQAITNNLARALRSTNVELTSWQLAAGSLDEADQLLAAEIDPVKTFMDALDNPNP